MTARIRYDLYLSYSGRRTYVKCPKKYKLQYVERLGVKSDIKDVGFGLIIGKLFEWFYNKRVWAASDCMGAMAELFVPAIREVFEKEGADLDPVLCQRLIDELHEFVPSTVASIRSHSLLTENSRSEVDLTTLYSIPESGLTLKIGGRADFLHGVGGSAWIMDGKGSKHREQYVDSEQLIWYAVQHYLKHKVVPVRLGFLYYKFPNDPVQWISYEAQDLRKSVQVTFEVAKKILLKQFESTPGPECSVCGFRSGCEEGRKYVAARKMEDGGRIESSMFDLERV